MGESDLFDCVDRLLRAAGAEAEAVALGGHVDVLEAGRPKTPRELLRVDHDPGVADVEKGEAEPAAGAVGAGNGAPGFKTRCTSAKSRSWASSDGTWWSMVKQTAAV